MSDTTQVTQVTNEQLFMKMEELIMKMNELSITGTPAVETKTKKSIGSRVIKSYNCDHCQKDTYIDSKGIEKKLTRRSRLVGCSHGFCRPCLLNKFKTPENGDSCPVEDCIGKMPASKMEELLNPGAKGRKIAQNKKKEKKEKVEPKVEQVSLSPKTPEMEINESDADSLAGLLENINDSF